MTQKKTLHVFSVNHKHAPTEVREKAHLTDEQAFALMDLVSSSPEGISCIPVSTCNRTEIYLETVPGCDPGPLLSQAMATAGADADVFFGHHARVYSDLEAIGHLFRVSAGLESMMLGEPQISSQLKDAYRRARQDREPGPGLLRAFQGCFRAGKRVRTETRINRGAVSVAFAAVELARKFFSSLNLQRAVLVGAGETGSLAAKHFLQHDIGHLTVINRSADRAQELVETLNEGEENILLDRIIPRPWEELTEALVDADVVLSTTGATEPVITAPMVQKAANQRRGKPLFLLDIAVPRDIHPDVADINNVFVFGLEDLQTIIEMNLAARQKQIPHALKIIDEELAEFQQWLNDVDLRPTVAEFKSYLEKLKDKQVGFVRKKQSEEIAAAVDSSLQQFIKKVLGRSVSSLKNANSPEEREQELELLRKLFSETD
jgi:glutamyl-tRNA reductase